MKNLLLALVALLLPVVAAAQFSVSGKVVDQQTGQPLPGATVVLRGMQTSPTTVTNANGNYELTNVIAGSYVLRATYVGYQVGQKTFNLTGNLTVNLSLTAGTMQAEEVTVSATRASSNSPTTFTNLRRKDIQKNNLGQDLPFLLNQTPSAVTTSDAGAGVGYTGIRIRGSDATRINVTINGIPYNDPESQGSYFVDLPDFTSSVDNIQIQRGVGTSTNGAGAFGASINIQTTTRRDTAYAELNNSAGSYGTVKNTLQLGTGLLGGKFSFDGRLSRINSDGYIDRAFSKLKSYFLSGAYYGKSSVIRVNIFSGQEQTYQAWNGVTADSMAIGNRHYNELGKIDARPGTFYNNQTDNYTQNHYQFIYDQRLGRGLSFSGALHYTKGYGYYEEYKNGQLISSYGIVPAQIKIDANPAHNIVKDTTDLVRRLWLNNDFYGATYTLKYQPDDKLNLIYGGAYNEYKGQHYNNIEWTQESSTIPPDYEYSRNDAKKKDLNNFVRAEYQAGKFFLYGDLQYRHINYSFLGYDRNLQNVQQDVQLNFFNPKAGITYQLNAQNSIYASWAVGHREPNRDDYTNSTPLSRPKAETLHDFEGGYRMRSSIFTGGINGFYMLYKNQLVLTGAFNDVGAQVRTNVKDSYRAGVELDGTLRIARQLYWGANAALSTNKIKNYEQYFYNWDTEENVLMKYGKTDIAYSPSFVGNSEISYRPIKGAEIAFISKYVSRQYLDNTFNINPVNYTTAPEADASQYLRDRYLKGYFVNNVRLNYNFSISEFKNIGITLLVNNIFSKKYEANGATYPDIEGGHVVNYNYFFPQAPRNFLASVNLRF